MAKTQSQTFNLSNDADVAAARAKLIDLQGKLVEAERQFRQASEDANPARTARSAAVDRELGVKPAAPAPNLEVARERLRVLEVAITKQRGVIVNAERAASERIAKDAKPGYVAIVKRMAAAVADLVRASLDERAYRESLIAGDVRLSPTIRPMPLQGSLKAGDTDLFDRWLAEAREHYSL